MDTVTKEPQILFTPLLMYLPDFNCTGPLEKLKLKKFVTFTMRIKTILFLIRLDQICPKWIKLDQMCIFHLSKNVTIKSCQIYLKNNHDQLFLTRSDEICPKWIKMDQT